MDSGTKTWLGVRRAAASLCLLLTANLVSAQFREIGPPPVSETVARQQVRTLLEKVNADNRQQTVATISGLLVWYRDLVDEEVIAAWKGDNRANLPEVIEALADSPLASAIVEYSWREGRQGAFKLAYAPMLEHLMARYPESAKPFVEDLRKMPSLSQQEAEVVCRILLDLRDVGTWKETALQILPQYRRTAEALLAQDIQGSDKEKGYTAQRWQDDLRVPGSAPAPVPRRVLPAVPAAPNSRNAGSAPNPNRPSLRLTSTGEVLTPLDPAVVDDKSASVNGVPALIEFQNRSSGAVDIYWINFNGDRVLYLPGLKVGATWLERSFTNHFWLVVVAGTGGTTAQDSGTRLAGFQPVTPNATFDPVKRDTAIIGNPAASPAAAAEPANVPAQPAAPDTVFKAGGGVSPPAVTSKIDPGYSEVARKLHLTEGSVMLTAIVRPDGTPSDIAVVRSLGYGLDEKAMEAVGRWQFKPGMKDGNPVAVRVNISVNFRLIRPPNESSWASGPMAFSVGTGVKPPLVTDGTLPKAGGTGDPNDNIVLEFTVDTSGTVKNIHALRGSEASSQLLKASLATWKFQPAMKGNEPVQAAGTVSFVQKPDPVANVNPELKLDGTIRRIGETELLLQTASGKVLRFRLLPTTAFQDIAGNPVRDSLLHPGDSIAVHVNGADITTAIHVTFAKAGSASERQTASAAVAEPRISAPDASDFPRP